MFRLQIRSKQTEDWIYIVENDGPFYEAETMDQAQRLLKIVKLKIKGPVDDNRFRVVELGDLPAGESR
jgi:hypothetical protein